jgi:hypothetical protein
MSYTINHDPEPWVTIEPNGSEFRTHTAHEDGRDANGRVWSGWTFSPRDEFNETVEERQAEDPEPWVTLDENGHEFRTRHAHEDGTDEYGRVWSGWTFAPREPGEF